MNSIFGSACKVSTGCSGVCYGCKTLTDPQTTPFPINRTKCPTALQTHTWWNMSHKRWQYEIYYKETLIIFLKIVSGCCSQPCGSPVLLAAPGCAVVTKGRFSRLRLSLSSPDHCLHVCNSFNTIKKASRKMKSLYVTFHENVKMWKWEPLFTQCVLTMQFPLTQEGRLFKQIQAKLPIQKNSPKRISFQKSWATFWKEGNPR